MTIERVQESESVTRRTRHNVLTLNESADEPGLIPDQVESTSEIREFLDDCSFGIGLQIRNNVVRLKTTCEIEHSTRCRRASRNFDAPRRNSQHLIVEPGVQHRFAEAPLISDFDSGQFPLRYQFEHRSLIEVQVSGELANSHQSVCWFAGLFRYLTDDV